MQRVPTKVAQFDTCMSGHCIYCTFKSKIKQLYKEIPLLGGQGECPPLRGDKACPRGDADGINN